MESIEYVSVTVVGVLDVLQKKVMLIEKLSMTSHVTIDSSLVWSQDAGTLGHVL